MRKVLLIFVLLYLSLSFLCAEVIYSQNFEGSWEDEWYTNEGVWEVGVPSSGPSTAHSGQKCLATILSGYYPVNTTAKFIKIVPLTVPNASQYPRLTWYEWFSFNQHSNGADKGLVLIKPVNGNDWTQIGNEKQSNSSGVWSHASVDLSGFAGQTVQLAFQLCAYNTYVGGDEDVGWYIDDIEIKTGVPVFNNPETWENGIGDWYVTNGTWEVGTPTSGPGSAYQGTMCLATNLSGYYTNWTLSKVISPPFYISNSTQIPFLRFRSWYSFNQDSGNADHGEVLIKPINDSIWVQVGSSVIMNSAVWYYAQYDISSYANQFVQIAFQLCVYDTYYSGDEDFGWYIDDVTITGLVENQDNTYTPAVFELNQNYPNPFSKNTNIDFNLPKRDRVCLEVYNIKGQKIKTLLNSIQKEGRCSVAWNGRNDRDIICPSGIYYYKMTTSTQTQLRRMILIK